ncbi:hypothetical protein CCR75_005282 [Bremia lactucae]|uniref:Uncharacterized protein n=1 Tax=Bremia lactucae TaxID=4779 RepID=A0A976FQ73_BRELC|nr:hypothetical protein CCR75_005282 [Bremia lactucae]
MFLQRYVHVVLDAVLGSYVKNIDPAALQISVWNGKIEVEAVELQPDAFPLPKQMCLVKGTLRQLRIDLPWTNFANQPIRVDIQDVCLLFKVCADDRTASDDDVKQRQSKLQRKRAALDAVEKAAEFSQKNKTNSQSWTQSFLFKLLAKVLDNVQLHVQHLHLRMEDSVSDVHHAYAVGMTLEAIIIKSADEGWNYIMAGRGEQVPNSMSFIRKKMDIHKFGIYWSLPLVPMPSVMLNDIEAFATLMRSPFLPSEDGSQKNEIPSLFQLTDYVIHPLTMSIKLTVNDGHEKLPITHQELSYRVVSRLGTPWMVETIQAIGDDVWREFLHVMPPLAGERKYTLSFVFSEAWSVARELTDEEDDIPSVSQFKQALSSCMQWSIKEVDRVEPCIVKYREAVVHVMQEKSTYIDAQASIDQISTSLTRQQYLSALSYISFITVKRRQARYLVLRPKKFRVQDNPRLWWKYAINAVLLDVRERLAHVDWEALDRKRQRRDRYKELYLVIKHGATFAATLVSPNVRSLAKEMAHSEFDELEADMDVKELIKLRQAVRHDIIEKENLARKLQRDKAESSPSKQKPEIPASSRIWSYATWLAGTSGAAQSGHYLPSRQGGGIGVEDVKWSDQDTKDLYEAIDYHPENDRNKSQVSENGNLEITERLLSEHQHILYRLQLTLAKASFGLSLEDIPANLGGLTSLKAANATSACSSHLIASLNDVDIQLLVRPSCVELGLQLQDAFFYQSSRSLFQVNTPHQRRSVSFSATDFFLQRMEMDEVLEYHPVGARNQMSSVQLRYCEQKLPLMYLNIEAERQHNVNEELDTKHKNTIEDAAAAAYSLHVSLVTQPIKCNVNLMLLLDVVAVFSRPTNVDLSGLENSAWRRAQTLQHYSAAQLRDALARRTKVNIRLDVISPLINVIQSPPEVTKIPNGDEVSLLIFLGHLKAQTKHLSDTFDEAAAMDATAATKLAANRIMTDSSSDQNLYDVLEISISGIEVQILDGRSSEVARHVFRARAYSGKKSARHYLLEKTSLAFSFYMSVTPDDPSIPLLKLHGGVDSINLNLSATSFRSLVQLLLSFGDNFSAHAQRLCHRSSVIVAEVASQPLTRFISPTRPSKPRLARMTSSNIKAGVTALSSSESSGIHVAASEHSPINFAHLYQLDRKQSFRAKEIDDEDLLKLWKRIICQLQFGVGEIILTLQVRDMERDSGQIVRVRAVDISTHLKVRSYDKRLEFKLGTFLVEDILRSRPSLMSDVIEKKRFLVKSGNHGSVAYSKKSSDKFIIPSTPSSSEQLINVAITSIASDAVLPKDLNQWKHARLAPLSESVKDFSVWQDPLLTSLSFDASLRVLTVDVYQDTLAEVFAFFFKHKNDRETESDVRKQSISSSSLRSTSKDSGGSRKKALDDTDVLSVQSSVDTDANESSISRKVGKWVASSFMDKDPVITPVKEEIVVNTADVKNNNLEEGLPATMQFRLRIEGLSLFLHLDDKQRPKGMPSAFATLTAQQFCCCVQQFPRYLSMFAYLTSLKVCNVTLNDQQLSEIISHKRKTLEVKEDTLWIDRGGTPVYDNDEEVGHVPTLSEILVLLDNVPAVFTCAAQSYGADAIQEVWHPGYCSRYSVRLRSPRIRFLYSFFDDMFNYWVKGILLNTVLSILSREQTEMLWEGDFQITDTQGKPTQENELETDVEDMASSSDENLGTDVVSLFPLVDIQFEDTVIEMPPHRMSSEALLLRFESFRISNEGVVNSFLGMENRIVAKVLLNSSLKHVQLGMKALRIVTVILVDRNDVNKRLDSGGFITQSLLGLTHYTLSADARRDYNLKLNLSFHPVQLVCNQEQYDFILRVPIQNFRERSRYCFSQPAEQVARLLSRRFSLARSLDDVSSSSKTGTGADELSNETSISEYPNERHISLEMNVPEMTMELLQMQHGYHPSNYGDLDMNEKGKSNVGSICILTLTMLSGRADYNLTSGKVIAIADLEGVRIRDSRANSMMSASYRDVVVFERYKKGLLKAVHIQFWREVVDVDASTIGLNFDITRRQIGRYARKPLFRSVSSKANNRLFRSELSFRRADSEVSANSPKSTNSSQTGKTMRQSAEKPSSSVMKTEGIELLIDVAGFKVIPSNIYYDVIDFLTLPQGSREVDEGSVSSQTVAEAVSGLETLVTVPPVYQRISLELNLGLSALLLVEDPFKLKSRALMLSWESTVSFNYLRRTNDEYSHIEDSINELPIHGQDQLQFSIDLENINATSRLSEESVWAAEQSTDAASADCLKPIGLEIVAQMDLVANFLRFQATFDRVMELRFGYLDFLTMLAALEHMLRRPAISLQPPLSGRQQRSLSGSSFSSISGEIAESEVSSYAGRRNTSLSERIAKEPVRQRTAALYGLSLIYLVSASFRGRLETRPVVGFYSSTWRKRYLVLPYTAQQRQLVQSVAFQILPAPESRRQIGDEIYYGDRIILEAVVDNCSNSNETSPFKGVSAGTPPADVLTQSNVIRKYDQLGANGYLGPEGLAGVFETTIWKYGSTMFNSDKSVIYDRELIVFEELTIYRSFNKGKKFGAADTISQQMDFNSARSSPQVEGAHTVDWTGARGGGYLMFNGVGDAPIPFALSIVSSKGNSQFLQHKVKDSVGDTVNGVTEAGDLFETPSEAACTRDAVRNDQKLSAKKELKNRKSLASYSSFLQHLKILELTLPGVNATIVNDFHNMLLPLLHFRVATLHADLRGRLEDRFTAIASLRFGIQAYNSQLAVWEPVLEDFEVNMAYHVRGGVLCDYCMSERQSISPTGAALRCDGMPLCLFRTTRTEIFTNAASNSWESKNFIYRELLEQPDVQDGAKVANTFMLVVKDDLNLNVSRNMINVLVHFIALVTNATAANEALSSRLGPFIYVDNQSGIPFLVATHPSSSNDEIQTKADSLSFRRPTNLIDMPLEGPSGDTNEKILKAGETVFNNNAWSRRRLSTMLNDISSSDTAWIRVDSGERIATDIVAHEAPAGCVTSPLRRLLWLKPLSKSHVATSSKAIPVPIGYSNRSYLHLESSGKQRDSWHGESIICETVAEQGTLVLRLRGKIQLSNFFSIPIQVIYNDQRKETIEPGGITAHYIPIQYLETGTIAFCPLLSNGRVQPSEPLSIASLLRSNDAKFRIRSKNRQNVGSLELRKALTFYWDIHPSAEDDDGAFGMSLPPFQVILTALRKSERHETTITLWPPIILENLIPYELLYRTACMKSEEEVVWVTKNAASFSGACGKVSSGSSACIPELEILERDTDNGEIVQTPTVVGLSLALPQIQLGRFSHWSQDSFIYGCQSFCERIELNMRGESDLDDLTLTNKLTICVEITQLEKLRSRALNKLCPVVCRVFTEYWLIDRTSLSLAFYTADNFLIPSNHPSRLYDKDNDKAESSSVSLSVFSCESKQIVSKMKIGIQGGIGKREVQSEPFDISAVGVRGQIFVPTTRSRDARSLLSTIAEFGAPSDGLEATFKQYEFGVMIEQGPEKFSRSRVVTLVPRYYFVNSSNNYEIRIRQECSTDLNAEIRLCPQETKFFHWTDSRLPLRVQIRFVLAEKGHNKRDIASCAISSQWSAPFELSSVGNFVLRVKAKVRPAPPCLPDCFEGCEAKCEQFEEDVREIHNSDEDDEYAEAEHMLRRGLQLNVAVELHDPSFLVYLEEGNQKTNLSLSSSFEYKHHDRERTLTVKHKENEGFVPFKIKNECSNLALMVWQKTFVKDEKGNTMIGFVGGDLVLPFHTIDYVPFRFSAFPSVFVQVQKSTGLAFGTLRKGHPLHGHHSQAFESKFLADDRRDCSKLRIALTRAATKIQTHVVASFEVQLKKLQRLPTIDVSEGVVKKRIWSEVLLDEATKTLLVTDMLPGYSGEHKRRRRATLLRSWKRFNTSIVFISHVLAAHRAQLMEGTDASSFNDAAQSKKCVRFSVNINDMESKDCSDETEETKLDQQAEVAASIPLLVEDVKKSVALILCVRLVDVTYLEDVFLQAGRNDLASCQPFLTFSLKTNGEEAKVKLAPQSTTIFPRWLPACNSRTMLSACLLADRSKGMEESTSHEVGAGAEIVVEIREADKILFGSSVIATAQISLQNYCAAALIAAENELNGSQEVIEFLAPIRVARKSTDWSRAIPNASRIRFVMCCRRTLTTPFAAVESGEEGKCRLDVINELKDILSAYQLKKELDLLVRSKSQLKLLLERELVDTSTSGTNIPAALRSIPGDTLEEEKKESSLSQYIAGVNEDSLEARGRGINSVRGSAVSATTEESITDETYENMGDEKRLTAVLIGVSNIQIPIDIIHRNFKHAHVTTDHIEPKVYCTITYQESTRSALSVVAKASVGSVETNDQDHCGEDGSVTSLRGAAAIRSSSSHSHLQKIRTYQFPRGQTLGLDLIYRNGRVIVQGVVCDGPCGTLVYEGKIRIGDSVVAANGKSIVNLHRDASFAVIEKAMRWDEDAGAPILEQAPLAKFTLSFLYQSTTPERMTHIDTSRPPCAQATGQDAGILKFDAEWNRRVEFAETISTNTSDEEYVLVRVYLRNETSDHGLSASQESSIVPFLYFFGEDAMMDHLDHSRQDSRFDILLAECWVPLPPSSLSNTANPMLIDGNPMAEPSALTFNERICALYSPKQRAQQHSALEIIGQLRLALKWDYINPLKAANQHGDLSLHFQLEVARICVSIVDDGAWSSVASVAGPQQSKEVLCISLSDQDASAGVQLSFDQISDGKQVVNARIGHFQIDSQLLDTNYPVLLRPMRLVDTQMQEEAYTMARDRGGNDNNGKLNSLMLLPTVQLMAVFRRHSNVVEFDYIFGQLQELEIKLEDATLVALAHVFSGVNWSHTASKSRVNKEQMKSEDEFGSNLALKLLEIEWSTPTLLSTAAGGRLASSRNGGGSNTKVLLHWLLLCPVKVNVTFTSTTDRSLLLSLLSPDMSPLLSTLISAAAALVSNLDQAPIRVPEFYVENLLETTHTLAFYAMQHYLHHGLRSWYSIMGSVDFLGNPIGLVSTLGTGVKDFFYTPAQMLLEDENGLRIDNLRTGMTKGSKSLLRNTAVGIFHTTGKITETLGKGIALLAMDEQYNVQRQRASTRQIKKINDLGDAIAEGSKGLVGGVWDGIKGVVAAPVRGAEQNGASGFVVGIGKGVAGLIVKPTAGFLDLLTSLSRGAKTSAESLDGTDRNAFDTVTRFRLPRRFCPDGVLVSYSDREARGYAVLLLTSLDATDDYVYHLDYGMEPHRGLLLLTDKRLICLSGKNGQKLWEVALDSTLEIVVDGATLKVGQTTSPSRSYEIECDNGVAATNLRVAVESARVDVSATRYLLLNLEKSQEEVRITRNGRCGSGAGDITMNGEDRTDLYVLMESVHDRTVCGLSNEDLQSQPLRSVRVEVCHLQNKDAHANVPGRAIDKVLSFSVFQIQVYGGPYQWTVFRRFSEFRALCSQLEVAGYMLDGLPPLPARTFLLSTREPVAKYRQEALNIFLQEAIMHSSISRSAPMLNFLTREAREVRVSLPPLSPTGERSSQRAGDSP